MKMFWELLILEKIVMDTLLLNICVLSRWTKRLVGLFEEFTGSSGKQEDNIYVHAYLIFRLFRTYFIDNLFHFMRDFRKYTIRKMLVVSADNIDFIFTFFLYNLVNIINFYLYYDFQNFGTCILSILRIELISQLFSNFSLKIYNQNLLLDVVNLVTNHFSRFKFFVSSFLQQIIYLFINSYFCFLN